MTKTNKRRTPRQGRRSQGNRPSWLSVVLIVIMLLAGVCWWCDARRLEDDRQRMTIPESADAESLMKVTMPDGVTSEIIHYPGFIVSFNKDFRLANYSAWELTGEETQGDLPRYNRFAPDPKVEGCATDQDYRNSGYDRGHLAPAGDMKFDNEAMKACFYFTNITPQAKELNQKAWNRLEGNCRKWARRDSSLIIICGPILSDRMTRHIGPDAVPVPERFFKVILAPYTNPPRAIGFIMNNGNVEGGIQRAAVSVDEVEAITGFDFFATLPDDIENKIEAECNFPLWSKTR